MVGKSVVGWSGVREGGDVDVVLFAFLVGVWIGCEGGNGKVNRKQEASDWKWECSEVRFRSQAFANEEQSHPSGKSAIRTEVL
jgi:hypothetical protein